MLTKLFNKVLIAGGTWAVLIALFLGSMLFVHSFIPTERIEDNINKSFQMLSERPQMPKLPFFGGILNFDTFTDAVMLNMAQTYDSADPVAGALNNRICIDEVNNKYDFYNFKPGIVNSSTAETTTYGRYWQGHQVMLRPMLLLFTFKGITIFNLIFCIILFVLVVTTIRKVVSSSFAVWYAVFMILSLFPLAVVSAQFVDCFAISFIAILFLLRVPMLSKDLFTLGLSFFVIGGITVFFDFLTFPLMTLCYPALAICLAKKDNRNSLAASAIIGWGLGYAILWASKWVISYLLVNPDSFYEAITAANCRMVGTCDHPLIVTLILVFLSIMLLAGYYTSYRNRWKFLYILMIGSLPILWFLVLNNHSYVHFFFTWRTLMISVFCILYYFNLYGKYKKNSSSDSML